MTLICFLFSCNMQLKWIIMDVISQIVSPKPLCVSVCCVAADLKHLSSHKSLQSVFNNSLWSHLTSNQVPDVQRVTALHNGTTNSSLCTASGGNRLPCVGRLCGVTRCAARLSGWHNVRVTSARQVVARRWCSAETEAVDTGVYSPNVSALRRRGHSPSLCCVFFFFKLTAVLAWVCVTSYFYGIVMAKCIFLCQVLQGRESQRDRVDACFFSTHTSFGTAFYNDFLLPLF